MFKHCTSAFAAIVLSAQWEARLFSKLWHIPVNASEEAAPKACARWAVAVLLFNYPDVMDGFD